MSYDDSIDDNADKATHGTGLDPVDPLRCQAEFSSYHPFQLGGPLRKSWRCENTPVVIATEAQPGEDGLTGSMSLCADCQRVLLQQRGKNFCTFEPVASSPSTGD